MKKQMILLTAILVIAVVPFLTSASDISDMATYAAKFSWVKSTHDFEQIKKNVPVTASFEFTNHGNEPLVIISTKGSCGCTVANYTKGEILPGEKGNVTATYNAAKVGAFNKTVTVIANTSDEPMILTIKGEVVD